MVGSLLQPDVLATLARGCLCIVNKPRNCIVSGRKIGYYVHFAFVFFRSPTVSCASVHPASTDTHLVPAKVASSPSVHQHPARVDWR